MESKHRKFRSPPSFTNPLEVKFSLPQGPLDLEIGCGVGLHPIQYAQNHPSRTLIAIEKTRAKFEKFKGRLLHHDPLCNLFPVHGHAVSWVDQHLLDESLERVFLLYPNPLPKSSDRHKRWYSQPFMASLKKKLKHNGTLTLVSNHSWYTQDALQCLTKQFGYEILEQKTLTPLDEQPGRTHFERKYLLDGQTCHEIVFSKRN